MEKYKNINDYLESGTTLFDTKEEVKDLILRSALHLLGECAHNFDGDAEITEKVSQPLFILNDMIDNIE